MTLPTQVSVRHTRIDTAEVLHEIASFFTQNASSSSVGPLSVETRLLDSGLLDSLSMLQLTMHLSEKFGVEFEDGDFTMENFATAGSIASLISGKLSERA